MTSAPSTVAPARRAGRAAAMRERVLDAALAEFTERTYSGTAVPQVAATAGVAVGSVYRAFASKQDLANTVFRRCKSRMLEAITAEHDPDAPVRDQVLAMWRGLAAYAVADPAGLTYLEQQQHDGYLDAESQALSAQVEQAAAAVVVRGQRQGEVREGDPTLLVALVFGAFVGLGKAVRARGATPAEALTPAVVAATGEAAWALLAAPDPTSTGGSTRTPTRPSTRATASAATRATTRKAPR